MNRPNTVALAVSGLAAGFSIVCGAPPADSGATSAREGLQYLVGAWTRWLRPDGVVADVA